MGLYSKHWAKALTTFRSNILLGQLTAIILCLASIGLRFWIGDILTGFPFLTFFPALTVAAFVGGRWAGITAALLGAVLAKYYFIAPIHTFEVVWPTGWIALGFYGVTAAIIVGLMDATLSALDAERQLEKRLQMALSAGGGVGTWDWDVQADRVVADERFAHLYGVDPEKARIGAPIQDFFVRMHPDDSPRVRAAIERSVSTGGYFREDYRLIQDDKSVRWVAAEGRCTYNAEGKPAQFPGVSFDITARRAVEEKIRLLNTDLERQVVERSSERGTTWQLSPHLLSVLDLETATFARVNPAWTEVLGWSEDELVGKPYYDFLHPDDVDASKAAWEQVKHGDAVLNFENRYLTRKGEIRTLSWVAVPENGRLYSTARDVTLEKEGANQLHVAQESLRQSQKMEAVGQLTGGLAHDFNNMLAGIIGSLEMLERRISQGRLEGIQRFIEGAQNSAKRAAALTQRLLAFSRRQTLTPKPILVSLLLEGVYDLLRHSVGATVQLHFEDDRTNWPTFVDPGQLENALLNLCINARDAMPDGGQITIKVKNLTLEEKEAKEMELLSGDYVSVSIRDTGVGIPAEVIPRVFDPFFTTKPLGQGTGLGLSMVYGFAKQSNGQIQVLSEVGKGTTICLYLPRYTGVTGEQLDEVSAPNFVPVGRGETILYVDDEPIIRMLLADVIQDAGYEGIEAEDGAGALAILRSGRRIDLLVTDVGLPGGLNGRQVADAALVLRPHLKVLFLTGYAESTVMKGADIGEKTQLLSKPFTVEVLAEKLKEMIGAA